MFWKKAHNKPSENEQENSVLSYHAIAITDTGCVRDHNEDAVRFVRPAEETVRENMGCLAIVADGMGGHTSGEVASAIAIDTISEAYYEKHRDPIKALESASSKANKLIWQTAGSDNKLQGMGTTCTAVAIVREKLYILHIGDSRIYLYKNGQLTQLSEDHTYVQELIKSGQITSDEARNHPDNNILTKSLGTAKDRKCDVFLSQHIFEPTDKLLLCSDGLYEYFSEDELIEYLSQPDLKEIAEELKEIVLEQGAHDNFSILLIESREENKSTSIPTRFIFETS